MTRYRIWQFYQREKRTIALALTAGGFLFLFWYIADVVLEGVTASFDKSLTLALQHPANPVWLREMARDVTSLGSFAVLFIVVAVVEGYLVLLRKPAVAVFVLLAIAGGAIMNSLLKAAIARPRPDILPHAAQVFTASFPSGHAALSAMTYLTLAALLARTTRSLPIRYYFITTGVLLSLSVGVTRIYLGVHYPTDVIAGWCIGAAWALACWALMARLQWSGQLEAPDPTPK